LDPPAEALARSVNRAGLGDGYEEMG